MQLHEVKSKLGVEQLHLNWSTDAEGNRALDTDGAPTQWMRHWDNDSRVAVSIHADTVERIKQDPTTNLGIQTEVREGSKGEYTAHRIVAFTPAVVVL